MTAVIGQIIQGFKNFLSKLEEMAKYAVSELEKFSAKAAQQIQILMAAALREIKEKISRLIKAAKTKIESFTKRRNASTPDATTTSYATKIKNALSNGGRAAESVASKFKESSVALLKEVEAILKRLGETTYRGTKEFATVTGEAIKKIFETLKNIGEGAIKEVKIFSEGFQKDLEIAGEFVHKHGVQMAEAATITILSPTLIFSVLASAGIIIVSHQQFIAPLENNPTKTGQRRTRSAKAS
jgi:hypothetical protein